MIFDKVQERAKLKTSVARLMVKFFILSLTFNS